MATKRMKKHLPLVLLIVSAIMLTAACAFG